MWGHKTSKTAERRTGTAQLKASVPSFKKPLPFTPLFCVWVAPSTALTYWSLSRTRVLILDKLTWRDFQSFISILSTLLPSLSTLGACFLVILSISSGSSMVSDQASWSPLVFSFLCGRGVLRYLIPKQLHCLRSPFFFLSAVIGQQST